MKKGLVLTLVLMAMLALVLPVSAKAPIINDLPTVIIGDNGDSTGGTSPVYLMRYLNAFNLADPLLINRQNGYDVATKFHVFYQQDSADVPQVKPSGPPTTGSIIESMTNAEVTNLTVNGVGPGAAKDIVKGASGYFWMSLLNTTINNTTSSAYDLTPAANGAARPYPANSADPGTATLMLYAVEDDLPTTSAAVSAPAPLVVLSMSDEDDSFGGDSQEIYRATFEGSTNNWFYRAATAAPGVIPASGAATATGLGITKVAGSGSSLVWGSWYMSADGTASDFTQMDFTQAVLGTDIYMVQAILSSTASTAVSSPGFRLIYNNVLLDHLGGLQGLTYPFFGDGSDIIVPSAGVNKEVRVYFAPPFDLNGMGDAEAMADFSTLAPGTFTDIRGYAIQFDLVDSETADAGTIALEEIVISVMPRPADETPAQAWGTGGDDFTAVTHPWVGSTANATAYGFTAGTFSVTAANIVLNAVGGSGYAQASPDIIVGGVNDPGASSLAWVSSELNRYTVTVASAALNTAPHFRMMINTYTDNAGILSPWWFEDFGGTVPKAFYLPAAGSAVGVPKVAGSTISSYMWGHTAGTGTSAGWLFPGVDIFGIQMNNWPAENGNMTISAIKLEAGI